MGHLRRFGRAGGKEGREVGARFGYIANLYLATMENNFNGLKTFIKLFFSPVAKFFQVVLLPRIARSIVESLVE